MACNNICLIFSALHLLLPTGLRSSRSFQSSGLPWDFYRSRKKNVPWNTSFWGCNSCCNSWFGIFFLLLRAVQLETSCKSPKACQKCSLLASNSNIRELTSSAWVYILFPPSNLWQRNESLRFDQLSYAHWEFSSLTASCEKNMH